MDARAKELLDLREKIIKNSMLILLIQTVMIEQPFVTLGHCIHKIQPQTKILLTAENKKIPNFAHYAIVAYLEQGKIWLGLKFKEEEPIWQHHFPVQEFTIKTLKRFIDFAYAAYKFNAAKTDKTFSNIPKSLYSIFIENNVDYFNFWKLGYTKKAKKIQQEFNEDNFRKYKFDLESRLNKYQAIAKILIKLTKESTYKFINCNYGELNVRYIAENHQLYIRVENYIECKSNSKVMPLAEFHPKKYDNNYIGLEDITFYVKTSSKGCS